MRILVLFVNRCVTEITNPSFCPILNTRKNRSMHYLSQNPRKKILVASTPTVKVLVVRRSFVRHWAYTSSREISLVTHEIQQLALIGKGHVKVQHGKYVFNGFISLILDNWAVALVMCMFQITPQNLPYQHSENCAFELRLTRTIQ